MSRRLLVVLGVLVTVFALAARAQDRLPGKVDAKNKSDVKRPQDGTDPKIKIEDAATQQERLKRQFEEFRQKLVGLAQRLENSTKPEDREKAKVLRMAILKASEEGVETRFSSLIERLRGSNAFKNTEQLEDILSENEKLRKNLRDILDLLTKDDRDAEIRREKELARKLLEELKTVIRRQELVLTKTIEGRTKTPDLAKNQKNVRDATDRLINPKSNPGNEAKKGEGKDSKSGKQGVGEPKNDAKDPKADPKESKGGEGKDAKSGEGKDGKPSENKDGKSGEGKDAKSGEGKDGKGKEGKDGKSGEGKDGKGKEGKDGKSGEGKDGKNGKDGKSGEGKDGKPGEPKAGQPKAGQPKAGESKASKPGDGKSGDSKGKGEGKGDSKGSSGKPSQGKPSEGKPGQSGQPGQPSESKSDSGKGGQQQQQQQPPQSQEQSQIKKKIQDAEKYQEKAEDNLRKDNRKDAPEEEQRALDELNKAKKQLEDLLRQLREEEIERLLARLEARCRHMLAMQIAVRDGTVELDKVVQSNPNTQPTRADQQASNVLSDREDDIVKEARAGLKLLEEEGSAVAFAEVFQQVKGDMETVSARLRKTDTGVVTVTIENQIIETLQEMIEALKKAQADNKNKKSGPPGQSGPPPDPKLIDLLAELRMIRSMQKRVNDRTELYGKQYTGEQAPNPEASGTPDERERYDRIQAELKDLSKRQQKIGKVTHDIATGKNESK